VCVLIFCHFLLPEEGMTSVFTLTLSVHVFIAEEWTY